MNTGVPFAIVTVIETTGSVPQNAGSRMLVTEGGWYWGTIGGGRVEKRAIDEALAMLKERVDSPSGVDTRLYEWSLSKDIGMTCGGSVKVYFEAHNRGDWRVAVFGAGHVGNALVTMLSRLDCRIDCFDTREDWLARLPESPRLRIQLVKDMPSRVGELVDGTFVVLVTMGHATDAPVLLEVLKQYSPERFPYIGVIGSRAKAARLRKEVVEAGLDSGLAEVFKCPMGLDIGSNHPQEIAISIVSQLLKVRDSWKKAGDS